MKDLLEIVKEEFGDRIIDIDEYDDEVKISIEDSEIVINEDKKIDIYRRYIYSDDDGNEIVENQERERGIFEEILLNEFKENPQVCDDSCIGCPAVDEIVGYFGKEFDISFIRKFINL